MPPVQTPLGRPALVGWEGKLTTYDLLSPVRGISGRAVTVALYAPAGKGGSWTVQDE